MRAAVASVYPKAALTDAEGRRARARSAMRPAVQREPQSAKRRCAAGVMGTKGRGKLVDFLTCTGQTPLLSENCRYISVNNKSFPEIMVLAAFLHVTHMIISNNVHIIIEETTAGKRRGEQTWHRDWMGTIPEKLPNYDLGSIYACKAFYYLKK